jgi:hypothetical protein
MMSVCNMEVTIESRGIENAELEACFMIDSPHVIYIFMHMNECISS